MFIVCVSFVTVIGVDYGWWGVQGCRCRLCWCGCCGVEVGSVVAGTGVLSLGRVLLGTGMAAYDWSSWGAAVSMWSEGASPGLSCGMGGHGGARGAGVVCKVGIVEGGKWWR